MTAMQLTRHFFERRVQRYTPAQMEIAYVLYDLWKPQSVFDLGCAIGGYLRGFADCGCKICGCDIGWPLAAEFMDLHVQDNTFEHDATVMLNIGEKFDLTMSVEVAEHFEPEGSMVFCENLVRHSSNRILLTAAGPGQRGSHHINCQHKHYWIDCMTACGANFNLGETINAATKINGIGDKLGLTKNLMVFTV